jgi:uncharacterized protein YjiS (DUF1127 family)
LIQLWLAMAKPKANAKAKKANAPPKIRDLRRTLVRNKCEFFTVRTLVRTVKNWVAKAMSTAELDEFLAAGQKEQLKMAVNFGILFID